jgi:hypothetical protein
MISCQFFESHVIRAFQNGMILDIGIVSQMQHITACFDSVGVKPGAGFGRRDVPALISIQGRTPGTATRAGEATQGGGETPPHRHPHT